MIRLLITGSRTWTDEKLIHWQIVRCMSAYGISRVQLIHGDCPQGADAIADQFARAEGLPVVTYPADWKTFGKSAGYLRNAEMVRAGADFCLAFIKDESRGATMTARLAESSGIPTYIFKE